MSTTKTIEVTVRPDGTSVVETKGFTGSECREASALLKVALGKTTSERLTAEFHQSQAAETAAVEPG